jgi:hypothetical protein
LQASPGRWQGWFGSYDGGQAFNVGGNIQVSSFVYQRGSPTYRCWDNGDFTFGVGIAGSTLVQRAGDGGIQAQNVYMPSASQPGRPTYVAGQNNDGYLRWWPANAVGPPAVARYLMSTLTLPSLSSGGGSGQATVNVVSNSLGATIPGGNTVSLPYTGWYSIAGGFRGNNQTGNTETLHCNLWSTTRGLLDIADASLTVTPSAFGGFFTYAGLLNAGEVIRLDFQDSFDQISGNGEMLIAFIPIADYPN